MWKSHWNKVCGLFIILGAASLVTILVASDASSSNSSPSADPDISGAYLLAFHAFDPDAGNCDDCEILKYSVRSTTTASVYVEPSGTCGGNAPCYSTIQTAIDAASSGNAIKIAEGSYDEALSLSSSKDLTLQGGWDSTFTSQSSNTTVNSLTISNGSIEVDKLILQSSSSGWTFTEDNVSLGITGVSPEAILLSDDSVRLYVTGGSQGMTLYRASDGLTFTEETASLPLGGSDPTLIRLGDGTYRMYYNDRDTIKTATSPDGLVWTEESSTGISNTNNNGAWGVPDSVELPDGRVRLYWVDTPIYVTPPNGYEVVKSAVSPDGLTFTEESGYRTENTNGEGGWADPHVLLAEEGNWVGLFSFIPPFTEENPNEPMTIHVGTSTDGLTWSLDSEPIITVTGGHVGDPASYPLGDGSYRVYHVATSELNPPHNYFITSGILKPK